MTAKLVRRLGRIPIRKRSRQQAEALTHAVNHWIRVEALAILHEGAYSAGEVAEMIDEDVKLVRGHLLDLYNSGCIEIAGIKAVGNVEKILYRAIALPRVSPATYRRMSIPERRDLNGAVVQGLLAESVFSYRVGKMDSDEDLYLVWDAICVDAQGEHELHDLLADSYEGAKNIHAKSINRIVKSKETGTTKVVGLVGFERGRPGRPEGGYYKERKK